MLLANVSTRNPPPICNLFNGLVTPMPTFCAAIFFAQRIKRKMKKGRDRNIFFINKFLDCNFFKTDGKCPGGLEGRVMIILFFLLSIAALSSIDLSAIAADLFFYS